MMKKKSICIVGGVYDMTTMGIDDVKKYVQSDLDFIYGERNLLFDMSVDSDGAYRLCFKRKYGEFYSPSRTSFGSDKSVFAPEAHILLGSMRRDHPTYADLQSWENAYIHYLSLEDVLKDYQKASKVRGSEVVKSLDMKESDSEVEFIVGF